MNKAQKWMAVLLCMAILATIVGCNKNSPNDDLEIEVPICKNAEEVITYLEEIGPKIGLHNASTDLKLQNETSVDGETFYRLQQCYQGIPVLGCTAVCVTDGNGKQVALVGNLKDIAPGIKTTPALTYEQIVERLQEELIISKKWSADVSNCSLCIFINPDNDNCHLAYQLDLGITKYIIDAYSGEVLDKIDSLSSESSIGYTASDIMRVAGFTVTKEINGSYSLKDEQRGVFVYDLNGENSDIHLGSPDAIAEAISQPVNSIDNVFGNDPITEPHHEAGAILLRNIEKLTDLFNSKLGYTAPNNRVRLFYNDSFSNGVNGRGGIALSEGMIILGTNQDVNQIDVLAHEYGHVVSQTIVGLTRSELDEGFSDLFGELSEALLYDSDPDWIHTTAVKGKDRNLKNPHASNNAASINDKNSKGIDNHGESYYYSTIVGHIAYLMNQGIDGNARKKISELQLLKLWYRALLMMPSNCDFATCRTMVELASKAMNFTYEQLSCVSEAFDKVGIVKRSTADYIAGPGTSLTVLDANGNPYENYTYQITGKVYGMSNVELSRYSKTISVNTTEPQLLDLADGEYSIRIVDHIDAPQPISFTLDFDRYAPSTEIKIATNFKAINKTQPSASDSPAVNDAVSYTMQHEYYEYKTDDGELCYRTQLDYPLFIGTSSVETQLNRLYADAVAERTYADWNAEDWLSSNEPEMLPWFQDLSIEISYDQGRYLSVKELESFFLDGAHNYHYINGHTYDIQSGEELDIHSFIIGSDSEINRLASKYNTTIYDFEKHTWETFYLTEEGVCLLYRDGDAEPYEEIVIPYTDKDTCTISVSESNTLQAEQISADDIAQFAKDAGSHLNCWFYTCYYADYSLTFDEGGGLWGGGSTYCWVNHPGINSVDALKDLTRTFFSAQTTNRILQENASRWKEKDGKLFWATDGGVGDHMIEEIGLVIQKESDTSYHIIFLKSGMDSLSASLPDASEANLIVENGRWVFDSTIPEPDSYTKYKVLKEREAEALLQQKANRSTNADDYPKPTRTVQYQPNRWICGDDVRYIQAALIEMNYSDVYLSGVFDKSTADAVGRFQKNHDMSVTGIVDAATSDALEKYLAKWRKKQTQPASSGSKSGGFDEKLNHEEQIKQIRAWYDETIREQDSLRYKTYADAASAYWRGDTPVSVIYPEMEFYDGYDEATDNHYYYHDGELYFVFSVKYSNAGQSELRLYFWNGKLIRWIENDGVVHETSNAAYQSVYEKAMDAYQFVLDVEADPSILN